MDEYFCSLDDTSRNALERVRRIALEVVPEAIDGTSYGSAALRFRGRPLLGFLAAAHHLSVFPFSPAVIDSVRDRLGGFDVSKGAVRFTAETPLPDDVVRAIVAGRREEIDRATTA